MVCHGGVGDSEPCGVALLPDRHAEEIPLLTRKTDTFPYRGFLFPIATGCQGRSMIALLLVGKVANRRVDTCYSSCSASPSVLPCGNPPPSRREALHKFGAKKSILFLLPKPCAQQGSLREGAGADGAKRSKKATEGEPEHDDKQVSICLFVTLSI